MLMRFGRSLFVALSAVLVCDTAFSETTTLYQYDELGRLQVVRDEAGRITTYGLDAAGNRVSLTTDVNTIPPPGSGSLQFAASGFSAIENGGVATVTVSRTGGSIGTVAVRYATSATGTATAGGDYLGTSGVLSWSNGDTADKTFAVPIVNDAVYEGTENFGVVLSGAIGVQLGAQASASVSITEDDAPDSTPPSAPTGLTGSAPSSGLVNLSWKASTDTGGSGLAGYRIYRNSSGQGTTASTSYADSTVAGTVQYTYQVQAYDSAGNSSALSAPFTIKTPDTLAPSVPTDLTATAVAYNQISLNCNPSTDTGGSGVWYYKFYRDGVERGSSVQLPYLDFFGIVQNTTYSYRVSAVDFAGNESGQSSPVSVTTPPQPVNPPGAPNWTNGYENCTSVCITGPSGEVLTWALGGGGTPGEYRLEILKPPAGWTNLGSPVSPQFVIAVDPGFTWKYRVRACNTAGCGPYSTEIGFYHDPNP